MYSLVEMTVLFLTHLGIAFLIDFYSCSNSQDLHFILLQAWIMNATVRDNILLGKPYNDARLVEGSLAGEEIRGMCANTSAHMS